MSYGAVFGKLLRAVVSSQTSLKMYSKSEPARQTYDSRRTTDYARRRCIVIIIILYSIPYRTIRQVALRAIVRK